LPKIVIIILTLGQVILVPSSTSKDVWSRCGSVDEEINEKQTIHGSLFTRVTFFLKRKKSCLLNIVVVKCPGRSIYIDI
jgi:hypothetical protein